MPGHSGRAWTLWNTANDGTSLVYVLVSWDNDDATDYLAARAGGSISPGSILLTFTFRGPRAACS